MELNEKDINKLVIMGLILILAVLVFLLLRPLIYTILAGIVLAYIFYPIYRKINNQIKIASLSSSIVTLIVILLIVIPIWLFLPTMIQQVFKIFVTLQGLEIGQVVVSIFPTASEQFITQTSIAFSSFSGKLASSSLNFLANLLFSFPTLLLHFFVLGFVFFYALRDGAKCKNFISEISPFNSHQNKLLFNQFKSITDSIVYGQVVIGTLQGIVAGIGFLIFGIPNALVLTVLAVILGIIPVIGPGLIWIPVTIYLFATGQTGIGFIYLAFNAIIVTSIDNILRTYIISKRSEISAIVIFIGMIGGILVFGAMGVIIGPLILTYFLTLLKAYREKTIGSIFKN